jgi:hypothetical protein
VLIVNTNRQEPLVSCAYRSQQMSRHRRRSNTKHRSKQMEKEKRIMSRWKWIYHPDDRSQLLRQVGVDADCSLYNTNGYPEDLVRRAVAAAQERRHQRHSEAAKKAAVTRRERKERSVYAAAQRILRNEKCGPRNNCIICRRGLGDPESIQRGIGSECWQGVLQAITRLRQTAA